MKTLFSLPKNDDFFNRYATLIPTLRKLGILSQFINAFTEFGIVYAVMFAMLTDHWGKFAQPLSFIGAIVGTCIIELGLRQFLPYSCRAILYKRFKGLDAWMTGFILITCIALFSCSITLSFKGSHSLVENSTPPPTQQNTVEADGQLNDGQSKTLQLFTSDSLEIAQRYELLINSQKNVYKSKIDKERANLTRYDSSPQKYSTIIGNIKAKVNDIEVQRNAILADLERQKAKEIQEANSRKFANMERITAYHSEATSGIKSQNATAQTKHETKVRTVGSGLAWFTLIFHFVLILAVAIEEMNNKGSGIEQVAQPNQYHFSESIFASLLNTLSDKWNCTARTFIQKWADKTPPPPRPSEPPTLFELADWKPRRTTIAPSILEGIQANRAMNLSTNNKRYTLRSRIVTDPPPSSSESEPTPRVRNNAMSYDKKTDEVVQADSSLKPCAWCNELFRPRTTWQKFCKTDCKLAEHEKKHGQPFDIAKAKFNRKHKV